MAKLFYTCGNISPPSKLLSAKCERNFAPCSQSPPVTGPNPSTKVGISSLGIKLPVHPVWASAQNIREMG